ncbi:MULTISPECIES: hypothetical protein [unclassified Streptomyces]
MSENHMWCDRGAGIWKDNRRDVKCNRGTSPGGLAQSVTRP